MSTEKIIQNKGNQRQSALSTQKHKLQIQKNQLKVIINDFQKVKNKCSILSNQLDQDFLNKDKYDKIERTSLIKLELLDLQGIVGLKNQLIRALTELYDVEHELAYKKQRNQMKFNSPKPPQIIKRAEFPPQIQKFTIQVPTYCSREQQNLQKIDRISSYLYDLRKNMRRLSTAVFKNYQTTDFLINEPQYLQVKEKLERYKMRSEQLTHLIQNKIQKQVESFFQSCQCVEDNNEYKIIKVYQNDVKDLGSRYDMAQAKEGEGYTMSPRNQRNFKVNKKTKTQFQNLKQIQITSLRLLTSNKRKEEKLTSIKANEDKTKKANDSQSNFVRTKKFDKKLEILEEKQAKQQEEGKQLILIKESKKQLLQKNGKQMQNKGKEQNGKSSDIISSLSSLRSKRKKIFDDDVWDEFDKI